MVDQGSDEALFNMFNKAISEANCVRCKSIDSTEAFGSKNRVKYISHWNFGEKFYDSEIRIAFVGKTSWMHPRVFGRPTPESMFWDVRSEITNKKVAYNADRYTSKGAFWKYIKDISDAIHKTPAKSLDFLKYIYITNLSKCWYCQDTIDYKENNPMYYYIQCFDLFKKEIKIVNPTHLIFFTNNKFDSILKCLSHSKEITNSSCRRKFEKTEENKIRYYPWWSRVHPSPSGKMYSLRTRHPQGTISEFKQGIIKWIEKPGKPPIFS